MKKAFTMALACALILSSCNCRQGKKAQCTEETADAVEFLRLNVPVTVDPAAAEATIELATKLVEASLNDEGVMEYDLYKSETKETSLLIYETWKDQASLDKHSAAEHFTTLVPKIQETASSMAIEQFAQVAEPETEGKCIRINCHIVAKDEESKAGLLALCQELVAASQSDEGMIEYDILSSCTRPLQLMIYETWENQAVLDAHSASEHFTTLVPKIQEAAASMAIQIFYK